MNVLNLKTRIELSLKVYLKKENVLSEALERKFIVTVPLNHSLVTVVFSALLLPSKRSKFLSQKKKQ